MSVKGEEFDETNCSLNLTADTEPHKQGEDAQSIDKENICQRFLRKKLLFFSILNLIVVNIVALSYFYFATIHWIKIDSGFNWCNGYGMLLLIYCFCYGRLVYNYFIEKFCIAPIYKTFDNLFCNCNHKKVIEIGICIIIALAIVIFLVIDTRNSPSRLIGLAGVFSLLVFGWILSKYPNQINWRPVIWGLILQFAFGLISIRWPIGRSAFECLSDKIVQFLDFSKDGAKFIFSDNLVEKNIFAFTVLPVIFFFSFVVQILYYLGVMQYVISKVGWALYAVLGTTACESLHAATTLFLGMPESFLIIEPYINQLTGSEIHAVMASCFATTSGTVMAAYISFGAQPVHLITATIMSAPAGLSFAKLLYPETKKSSTNFNEIVLKKSNESSFLDAASKGALSAIPLVLGIIANIIAFVSAISLLNSILAWSGNLIGYPQITFQYILGKVFIPLSYVIGVPWSECELVGELIGLKTIVNEFVAYEQLGRFKKENKLSVRAEAIATYAICGFSNPSSLGIMIGSLSTMAPNKKTDIVNSVVRAFIAGCGVCFLTASVAGVLIDEKSF